MKKKWIWIIALIVVLILAGIAAVIMLDRDGNDNNGSNNNETSTATIGTIKIPGNDSATKVIFTHPPELEGKWEKPTVSALEIEISGQITNISDRNVSFDLYFLFDGQTGDYMFPQTLRPGETVKIVKNQMIASGWGKKVLEIKAVIQKPATTVPPAITPSSATPPETETQVFTSAPRNPKTPKEVAAAFIFAVIEGDYAKFKEFASSGYLKLYPTKEKFEEEANSGEGKKFRHNFKAVEITKETIEGDTAELDGIFYFKNPTPDYPDATDPSVIFYLVKENGKWKVTEK